MKKDFVYITQSPDFVPHFVEELEKRGREVYILTYKKPLKHKRNIFMPKSTWGQGRNFMAKLLGGEKYLYNIFIDEDTVLKVNESFLKVGECKGKDVWDLFEEFLLEYEPSIGLPRYMPHNYTEKGKKVNTLYQYDHIILGIHRDIMPLHFPLFTQFDSISWYWSQVCANHLEAISCPSSILQCNYISTYNKQHLEYPQICAFGLLTKILRSSLLCDKDKYRLLKHNELKRVGVDWYTRYWFKSVGDGKYRKPYEGEYKDLLNEFRKRINKKHAIWKDHPFIEMGL